MSAYTSRMTMTAPVAMADLCAAIGRGIDEDWGGERAFRPVYTAYDADGFPVGEPIRLESAFYATDSFATGCEYLISTPEMLTESLERSYSSRWKDYVPPKLEDVRKWCEVVSFMREDQ